MENLQNTIVWQKGRIASLESLLKSAEEREASARLDVIDVQAQAVEDSQAAKELRDTLQEQLEVLKLLRMIQGLSRQMLVVQP